MGKNERAMTMTQTRSFSDELSQIENEGLLRFLHTLPSVGGRFEWDGRELLNFSSNDYVDLAGDPRLKKAACRAIEKYGSGATASRLMSGHLALHEELETRLAAFVGKESALVFPSGYQTNLGVLTVLAREGDAIFSDALNHASIIDGCRLSRADTFIYSHANMAELETLLQEAGANHERRVIVSDSVFSMDGDWAPLEDLAELAQRYHALLVIDEAHAIGVFGHGGGVCKELGVEPEVIVGTMSKSLGSGGGFAAGSNEFCNLLINKARSFIFSTGLAPGCLGSAIAALDILEADPAMGTRLRTQTDRFRWELREKGFEISDDCSQIIPIIIGDNLAAMDVSHACLEHGILLTAVRPPTVPEGTARLRLSVTLAHTDADFERAAHVIAETGVKAGVL